MSIRSSDMSASRRLQKRAHELIPGGCHTYAKGDDQYPQVAPPFIARGFGSHVWDIDGNEYIEYGMGNRAVGLGHAFGPVVEAAQSEMSRGCNFTRPASIEVECAETFLDLIEGAEMVKFCKSGSEATSAAVKLARAHTGRDLIAICGDHPFFSSDDWFIGTTVMNAGVPEQIKALTVTFKYNDLQSVRALFDKHPGRIAAVILEAARVDEPAPGFLHELRELCHADGTLFILDEMVTGFRWAVGGAQQAYGVVPDLSTFGKALGNGFSVSALAGRSEFMRLGGLGHFDRPRVFLLSTTHGAETHALAAAIATMRTYKNEPVIEHLIRQGERLRQQGSALVRGHGLENYVEFLGKPTCLLFATRDREGRPSQAMRTLFLQETIRRGVLMPSLVVSYSHSDEDIERTLEAIDAALAVYAKALDGGVDRFLIGPPSQPVMRSHNAAPAG
ncbi:glutamate-1-semialdehyde 2,1-aminomutase [Hyphomicrobium album]